MSKSKNSANGDIIAAAEAVYAILVELDVKACAIGSMAIAYTDKKKYGRYANSLDFVTFQQGHHQRSLNKLLIARDPTLFVIGDQSANNSHLPPLLYYKPPNSSQEKIRVFFLPLWTRHSQENIPHLDYDDAEEPKNPYTVPLAPIPFLIYLQLHGWAWNNSVARQNPANKRANAKRNNFASDLGFLLPLAVKGRAHFDWLTDEFKGRLKDSANDFVQDQPALCKEWAKMGVLGLEVKAKTTKKQSAGGKSAKGEGKSSQKGEKGKTQMIKDQLDLMKFEEAYPDGLDFND